MQYAIATISSDAVTAVLARGGVLHAAGINLLLSNLLSLILLIIGIRLLLISLIIILIG